MLLHLRLNLHKPFEKPHYNIFGVRILSSHVDFYRIVTEDSFPYSRDEAKKTNLSFESTDDNLREAAKHLYGNKWAYYSAALVDKNGIEVWHKERSALESLSGSLPLSIDMINTIKGYGSDGASTSKNNQENTGEPDPLTAEELDHIVIYIKARRLAAQHGGYLYNEARFTDRWNALSWQSDMGESIKEFSPHEFTEGDSQNDKPWTIQERYQETAKSKPVKPRF